MGQKTSPSEQQLAVAGARKPRGARSTAMEIERLREYAMETPESRKQVIGTLEEYTRKYRGTEKGEAASRAISKILAVSMLEALQSD